MNSGDKLQLDRCGAATVLLQGCNCAVARLQLAAGKIVLYRQITENFGVYFSAFLAVVGMQLSCCVAATGLLQGCNWAVARLQLGCCKAATPTDN
jgi:hypothetical protein